MSLIILTVTLAIIVLSLLYFYLKWVVTYWERRGVPTFPKSSTKIWEMTNESYFYFKSRGETHGGLYILYKPHYIPINLDLLKCVLVKNFDYFVNHGGYVNEKGDPLSANLPLLANEKWRNLRTKLTPTFTSGKIRMMFQTMEATTLPLIDLLNKEASLGDPVDIKEILARFTTDIIMSTAFGIDSNSLKDPESIFRRYGKLSMLPNTRKKIGSILPRSFLKLINFSRHSSELTEFYMEVVKQMIDYRESNNIYRKDFMHLMLQLKNRGIVVDDEKIMDDNKKGDFMKLEEITAQCYVFFVAGFETSSTLMTFALLELAQHQDVQDKLRKEMKAVLKNHNELSYEAIKEMNYLDQVVSETLRLHPPVFITNRVCNKSFKVPNTNVEIESGTNLLIPIYAIHHDPQYYPEPEKFDPERFSPENKAGRHPMAFLPFGEGPRMCIGARFAQLQSKVGLTSVLTNFRVTLHPRTSLPVEYHNHSLLLSVKGDVWLNMHKLDGRVENLMS